MKIGVGKMALAGFGLVVLAFGLWAAFSDFHRDTTVSGEHNERIHNTGLIADRQSSLTLDCTLAIVGAVLLAAACAVDAIQAHGERAAKADEQAARDRDLMLRQLGAIVANTGTLAKPARAVAAKREAAFDDAIAAEVAAGKGLR